MKKRKKAQTEEERQQEAKQKRLAEKEELLKNFLGKIYARKMTDTDIILLSDILEIEDYNELRGTYNDIIFQGFPYSQALRKVLYQYLDRIFQAELIDGGLVVNMLSHGYISQETFRLLHDNADIICLSGFSVALYPMLKRMLESGVKSNPHHEAEKLPLSEIEKENFRILLNDFRPEEMQLTLEEMAMVAKES